MSNLKDNQNRKSSDEDTVECYLFTPVNYDQNYINDLCKNINNKIKSLSEEYLWHIEEFKVHIPLEKQNDEVLPLHLASSFSFGDNIEDEWFVVYILLELSKEYKKIIIQVKDNDGDFLLIEAADYLPSWANPETTENRVFIHNGHIHLIPPNVAALENQLMLNEAMQFILTSPNQTKATAKIEDAILSRIHNYPEKIQENMHNALVKLPLEIATLLKLKPNLIAPIANAYCHHDVIDAKDFRNVAFDNWITVTVKFTKYLYAMLVHSKVPKTGRLLIEKDKKSTLGMKLACGYHMIRKKSSDIYSSKEYQRYLNSLIVNGYFRDNIEGSEEYKKLLQTAKDFFSAVECPIASTASNDITQIMSTETFLMTNKLLQNENRAIATMTEDSDDWLNLHPEQLNEFLNSRYGKTTKFQKGDRLTSQTLTTELNNFLKQTSDFEGIENNNKEQSDNKIDFDPDEFEDCIEKMLKLLTGNNENEETESVDSNISEDMSLSEDENELDKEIKERLQGKAENLSDNKIILENMIKSMKEEKSMIGPTSNLISNVGYNKTDFLDSDDD